MIETLRRIGLVRLGATMMGVGLLLDLGAAGDLTVVRFVSVTALTALAWILSWLHQRELDEFNDRLWVVSHRLEGIVESLGRDDEAT